MNTTLPSSSRPCVLLIDDDSDVHQAVAVLLGRAGIDMLGAPSPEDAYSLLERQRADAILLDLNFARGRTHGEEGFAALARLLGDDPNAAVVVITGHSGVRIAVAAMRAGAFDFVMKPWRNADLIERVQAAIAHRKRQDEIMALQRADGALPAPPRLLGSSAAIEHVRDLVRRIAPTSASVLVTGPAGSGRSLAGRAIHCSSARAVGEVVEIEALSASDPADVEAAAGLAQARDGTVLLRHADMLDTAAQVRLLSRLPADARVVATAESSATLSPPLRARIATVEIAMPPLAERPGDAVLLARHFARVAEERHGKPVRGFTGDAEALIAATVWPDEVRGLASAVERAVVLGDGEPIGIEQLGLVPVTRSDDEAPEKPRLSLEQSERSLIEAALKRHGFNISHAAGDLGLSRAALYRRMAKYGF